MGNREVLLQPRLGALRGRDEELRRMTRLIHRDGAVLVTVTGPLGVGKSRLVAQAVGPDALWADTAEIDRTGEVGGLREAIAARVGVAPRARVVVVVDDLQRQELGPALVRLLDSVPGTQMVVTSAGRLHVRGEVVVPLTPLALPQRPRDLLDPSPPPAAECFLDHAVRLVDGFKIDSGNAQSVFDVLHATGGLPLAIELVANWLRVLPIAEVATSCARSLELFSDGPADLPPHQRDLKTAVASCLASLPPECIRIARALAQFGGPASLDAVGVVMDEPCRLPFLSALIDAGIVSVEQHTTTPLVVLLPVVRRFLLDGPPDPVLQSGHERWLSELIDLHAPQIGGRATVAACEALERESRAMEEGLESLTAHPAQCAERVMLLEGFWRLVGRFEAAFRWSSRCLDLVPATDEHHPWLMLMACRALRDLGRYEQSGAMASAVWTDPNAVATARAAAGVERLRLDQIAAFHNSFDEGIGSEVMQLLEGVDGTAEPLWRRRVVRRLRRAMWCIEGESLLIAEADMTAVLECFELALAHAVADDDASDECWCHVLIATALQRSGNRDAHEQAARSAVQSAQRLGPRSVDLLYAHATLALHHASTAAVADARAEAVAALALLPSAGRPFDVAQAKRMVAVSLAEIGDSERATQLLSESLATTLVLGHEPLAANLLSALAVAAPPTGPGQQQRAQLLAVATEREPTTMLMSFGPWARRADELEAAPAAPMDFDAAVAFAAEFLARDLPSAARASDRRLSQREQEVLQLLGEGLTDQEIAVQLFIGVRTVNSHVSAILRKLGVASRRDAAVWALRGS